MRKLVFTNEYGESITLSTAWPYVLEDINGVESPQKTLSTMQMFNQDGTVYYGSNLNPRYINCMCTIKGSSKEDVLDKKQLLYEVLGTSTAEGFLIYSDGFREKRITAVVYDGPVQSSQQPVSESAIRMDIGFYCADPAWESIIEYGKKLVAFVGGLELPMTLPFTLATQGDSAEIDYKGQLPSPVLIEFRGASAMPKIIKNETGEYIEVEIDIEAGESLYISTDPYDIDIYKMVNGEKVDASNYVDPLSDYFLLTRGVNTIKFSAASGNPEVYIHYRERFIGI